MYYRLISIDCYKHLPCSWHCLADLYLAQIALQALGESFNSSTINPFRCHNIVATPDLTLLSLNRSRSHPPAL